MPSKTFSKIAIIGPAHPLRGGLASFDQRLCREFLNLGFDCCIYSFSLQYPSFLFPGTTQFAEGPGPEDITIHTAINSVSPLNWWKVGNRIRDEKPDLLIVRYWIPFMGPALGTILRRVRKNKHTKIIAITDNVLPHEKRPGDTLFTRYFLSACDGYVTMSDKVMNDLRQFEDKKPMKKVWHPLYDNFGEAVERTVARKQLDLPSDKKILLFFGFIRAYKGLDLLIQAMGLLKKERDSPKNEGKHEAMDQLILLIAGEYYDDPKKYKDLIRSTGINDMIIERTDFIPDEQVRYYLSACDGVVQPYRNATQSGVTPLAYHFEKPMIVTNVGSLPDLVPHNKVGLVCEPDPESLAAAIKSFFEKEETYFLPGLKSEKQKYSWENLVNALIEVAQT